MYLSYCISLHEYSNPQSNVIYSIRHTKVSQCEFFIFRKHSNIQEFKFTFDLWTHTCIHVQTYIWCVCVMCAWNLGKLIISAQLMKWLFHIINMLMHYILKYSDRIIREGQVYYSTWLFLGCAKHWEASTNGAGPLVGFNRMAWTHYRLHIIFPMCFPSNPLSTLQKPCSLVIVVTCVSSGCVC